MDHLLFQGGLETSFKKDWETQLARVNIHNYSEKIHSRGAHYIHSRWLLA